MVVSERGKCSEVERIVDMLKDDRGALDLVVKMAEAFAIRGSRTTSRRR